MEIFRCAAAACSVWSWFECHSLHSTHSVAHAHDCSLSARKKNNNNNDEKKKKKKKEFLPNSQIRKRDFFSFFLYVVCAWFWLRDLRPRLKTVRSSLGIRLFFLLLSSSLRLKKVYSLLWPEMVFGFRVKRRMAFFFLVYFLPFAFNAVFLGSHRRSFVVNWIEVIAALKTTQINGSLNSKFCWFDRYRRIFFFLSSFRTIESRRMSTVATIGVNVVRSWKFIILYIFSHFFL